MMDEMGTGAIETMKIADIAETGEIAEAPMEKIPSGLEKIEVNPDTDIYEPVTVRDIDLNHQETIVEKTASSSIYGNETDNNEDSELAKESDLDEEAAEYFSTYEERLQYTPINNGYWEGERGESKFYSYDEAVNKILAEFGLDGITYKNGIPDFSEVSRGTTGIDNMTENRSKNFAQADEALANQKGCTPQEVKKWREEHNYTWHERNDIKTMDKVPSEINAAFGHLGGVSECKKANEAIYEEDEFDE